MEDQTKGSIELMACYEIKVDPRADGLRIDECLRRFLPDVEPSAVQAAFRRRDVKLDGVRVKQDVRVSSGNLIQVYCMEKDAVALDIVYEDADVALINKRAGICIEPDEQGGISLTELLQRHYGENTFIRPCHRLDNQTCGLVMFARNARAETILTQVFKNRSLDKRYECLVRGMMKPPTAVCKAYLIKDSDKARVAVLDHPAKGAKSITTEYRTLEAGPVSRLEVHLVTGRTHQIRAHLAALGHPLLGDDVYGDRSFNRSQHARRLMLCARSLMLDTGGKLSQLDHRLFKIECPF